MKILVTGSSGLIGTALVKELVREGHRVCRLMRTGSSAKSAHAEENGGKKCEQSLGADSRGEGGATAAGGVVDVAWNPTTCDLEGAPFGEGQAIVEGADAVVNLAGAGIGQERWTEERKAVLRSSRVHTTRALVAALEKMGGRPQVFVSASAIGYYGDRGDEELTEESKPGDNFLARLAQEWEEEAVKAEALGMRVVRVRLGVVLAREGGALPEMMKPFRFGVGGKIGSGQQWMSWVALKDAVAALICAMQRGDLSGAVNVVAPKPVRNAEFARELALVMKRRSWMRAPAFALEMVLGTEMADELLLASQRVAPARLQEISYQFVYAELAPALRRILQAG